MSSQRILDAGKDIQNINGIVANDASDKSMIDAAKKDYLDFLPLPDFIEVKNSSLVLNDFNLSIKN